MLDFDFLFLLDRRRVSSILLEDSCDKTCRPGTSHVSPFVLINTSKGLGYVVPAEIFVSVLKYGV